MLTNLSWNHTAQLVREKKCRILKLLNYSVYFHATQPCASELGAILFLPSPDNRPGYSHEKI